MSVPVVLSVSRLQNPISYRRILTSNGFIHLLGFASTGAIPPTSCWVTVEGAFHASELGEPIMSKNSTVLNTLWRQLVLTFGVAATGAAIGAVATSDDVFAKQFACSAVEITLPEMTYDPELQMMVHPVT